MGGDGGWGWGGTGLGVVCSGSDGGYRGVTKD